MVDKTNWRVRVVTVVASSEPSVSRRSDAPSLTCLLFAKIEVSGDLLALASIDLLGFGIRLSRQWRMNEKDDNMMCVCCLLFWQTPICCRSIYCCLFGSPRATSLNSQFPTSKV